MPPGTEGSVIFPLTPVGLGWSVKNAQASQPHGGDARAKIQTGQVTTGEMYRGSIK